jgi:hypothetical protein
MLTERALGYAEEARDAAQAQVAAGAEQATQRIAALEATVAELQAALSKKSDDGDVSEIHVVRAHATAAAATVSDLTSEVAQLKQGLASALAKVAEAQSVEAATTSEATAAHAEVTELKNELQKTRAAVVKVQEVGVEVLKAQTMNTEIANFLINAQSLQTEMLELRGSLEKVSASNFAVGANTAVEDLRHELQVAKADASHKRAGLESEVEDLKRQLTQARAEAAAAFEDLSLLTKESPRASPSKRNQKQQQEQQRTSNRKQQQQQQQQKEEEEYYEDEQRLAGYRSPDETPRWLQALKNGRTLRLIAMAPLIVYLTVSGGGI